MVPKHDNYKENTAYQQKQIAICCVCYLLMFYHLFTRVQLHLMHVNDIYENMFFQLPLKITTYDREITNGN